ncbi:molybdopterin-dependent oxidoreductase [Aestuariivirga sp.]|uniref:molybdopterin-dependent oxidoreductase n=1 Tax=Aestuariivirga sp. TaxID=2650926 RepID=UPI003BACA7E9
MLRHWVFALILLVSGIAVAPFAIAGDAGEPVVLTVTGNVAHPNRGALDPFDDAVFAHLDVKFDKGFTFTLADLKALPQQTAKAKYNEWPREVTATGPSLADVLKAAGAEGKKILVQAIDGYAPEFTADDVARGKLILAVEADGKPLAMGGRGPLWLFGPRDSFADQQDEEGFAFAVIRIDVQ